MHKIERLLQTLAPKGVEFRKLGEVCEILDNRRIPIAKNKRNPGIYPYYGANGIQDYIDSYIFDGDFVLVGEDGSVINKDNTPVVNWASGKIWVNNHAHVLQTKSELKLKFLYFYLQTIDVSYCVAGTPPKINQENLKKITIPIPPLEIQQEIVKILDAFTELNTELNTELKARKKQYQYYQNMLLDFKDTHSNHKDAKIKTYPKRLKTLLQTLAPKGVEFRKLGDIGEFYSGLVGKSKKSFSQGNKFYVPYVNVFNNPQLDLNALESVQIGDKEKQNTIQLGDVLFTGSSENLEDCAMSCVVTQKIEKDIYLNSFCFGFRFFDENLFNPSFLKHFLRDYNFRKNISKVANGVTRFNVSKQLLSKITIPIPPLEIQQEIVKILDQFLALTTDLLAGIPAEIKARKKQYEYYREKLLTFKPLTPHKEVKKC
ncbi:restriction endonuclease subunit S [Helicobacter pylori]|uniref:restriction endonuclease subunit S n=1 Tax=Helicobacter pylori TaxID=210 RepID=UPI0019245F44|nr:restriction endonuclease subunit S [Helicobacter pylori]QQW87959.1 restriction endonuclease subunit S [Helicobacter pylori]